MSLLLAHGHPEAWSYPIGLVMDEARLVSERNNRTEALRARLTLVAVSATPNAFVDPKVAKKLTERFNEIMGLLEDEE